MAKDEKKGQKFDRFSDKKLTNVKPHERPANLDPKHNGPFLDDVRADQERAYREMRNRGSNPKR